MAQTYKGSINSANVIDNGEGTLDIKSLYTPRPFQALLHRALKRFSLLVCHRRFGKTVFCVNHLKNKAMQAVKVVKRPQYAYIAPTREAAKKIVWDYFKEYFGDLPGVSFNEQELKVRILLPGYEDNPITIYLLGSENGQSIRGMYFDGVICDEFSEWDPRIWRTVIRPALSDRKGWAIFIGTPKGANHFYDMHKYAILNQARGWFTVILKASQTKVIDEEELEDLKNELDEQEYNQEYECSFQAGVKGSYYLDQISKLEQEGKIRKVPYDPELGVFTAWDLGMNDSTSIWFIQMIGSEVRLIDYFETNGEGIPSISQKLLAKGYRYEKHWLPHDGEVKELTTGKTRKEVLEETMGWGTVECAPRLPLAETIDMVRRMLPRCYFDAVKTDDGLECLKAYRKEFDAKNNVFKPMPVHDWSSHGADSFRTLAVMLPTSYSGFNKRDLKKRPNRARMDYDPLD